MSAHPGQTWSAAPYADQVASSTPNMFDMSAGRVQRTDAFEEARQHTQYVSCVANAAGH